MPLSRIHYAQLSKMTTRGIKDHPDGPPELVREPGLSEDLLRWYGGSARDLPWRLNGDPYSVWVSEIMLQQTRVETVRPYYTRFLERFPTVESLAAAPEEEVLSRWSGLGYYSRARNLHRGAGVVRDEHGGRFPRDRTLALRIPGIGPYTSAAILSIAYGLSHAVVDGNVARVLARLFRIEPPWDKRSSYLEEQAEAILSPDRPGDHNQAMMELGATVCLPRNPKCETCPVAGVCRARIDGVVDQYPSRSIRRETVQIEQRLLLVEHPRHGLLLERGRWPLLPHLWLPPIVEYAGPEELPDSSWRRWARAVAPGLGTGPWVTLGLVRHSITHRRIRLHVSAAVMDGECRPSEQLRCARPDELAGLGRSSILTKALRLR